MRAKIIGTVALIVLGAGAARSAERQVILPEGAKPGGNYSPGILVGDTLYVSGQAGEDFEYYFRKRGAQT